MPAALLRRSTVAASRRTGGLLCRRWARSTGGRLSVVLDMDECLIHSADFSDESTGRTVAAGQVAGGGQGAGAAGVAAPIETFVTTMRDGVTCIVYKRPGLRDFISACTAEFDTYVFTAGTQAYAEPLLDTLDPGQLLKGRFYRQHCRRVQGGRAYLKDLHKVLPQVNPARIVLVDNNPISFVCQPDNGILVPDFHGLPEEGAPVLLGVLELLRQLDAEEDVRPTLTKQFRLGERLSAAKTHLLGQGERSRL